ncbi:hypothetical protein D9757_002319 [Collybiopsis confluens]|uniref:Protein kinase domain-containing protein n=1 Tax=Collybiopsis confluens TaxID=2823264 RepID=A0A8H5I0H4_9AGAR|nr:hypothetical protein D9757_002319 [Collybiopsis confluens]
MSTLQMIDTEGDVMNMWSWQSTAVTHQTARMTTQRLSAKVVVVYKGPQGREPTEAVVAKFARANKIHALEKEHRVYETRLNHLQGRVVPRCYGLYKGKNKYGEEVACLLLEYCIGSPGYSLEDRKYVFQPPEVVSVTDLTDYSSHSIMIAVCELHRTGILHGSLDDLSHIVFTSTQVRIISFSDVNEHHQCVGAIPLLSDPSGVTASRNGCPELVLMEKIYGIIDLLAKQHTEFHHEPVVPHRRRGRFWRA